MIEFMLGLVMGYALTGDLGEPVPYQTIKYTDSTQVVKIFRSDFHGHRYYPNALAIGWNTNDYRYWDTRPIKPLYVKTIHVNPKPKPKPKKNVE